MIIEYWTLVSLNTEDCLRQEIPLAKDFFLASFTDTTNINELSDIAIQRRLFEIYHNCSSQDKLLAQRCLLCFISCQIEKSCLKLARDFGSFHGFTHRDLLPYVLNDDGTFPPLIEHHCFAREILESFDVDKSSLTTWTTRKVRQHNQLNQFLLQCGLYLISDWAILNDTNTKQLQDILGGFHLLSKFEIQQAQTLLEAYHKVYRAERFRRRLQKQSAGKCETPSQSQLREITEVLVTKGIYSISIKAALNKLQNLATKLREYRIHARSGKFRTDSLDEKLENNFTFIEQFTVSNPKNVLDSTDEAEDFLENYRSQILICLDNALNTVIKARFEYLNKKNADKASKYLIALTLFHCQRLSMGIIAQQLGLRAQDAVTRLLKLGNLRADVRQQMMITLKESVINLAQQYSSISDLETLEMRITSAIDEQINKIISDSEIEAVNIQNNLAPSLFSESLCRQFQNKE